MRSVEQMHERSDLDLAVWGLNPRDYYRAVGQLQGLHPEIAVDLIEAESAPPRLLREIEATGVTL
jgi:predicted nucleotidyltransferase